MNRTGHSHFCVLLLGLVASCQSSETVKKVELGLSLPYKIYVYVDVPPMSSPEEPTGDEESATEWPIPVDTQGIERIERDLVVAAVPLQLCTKIMSRSSIEQDLETSLERARTRGADLLLHVECREPTYRFSHRNAWFLPNTILWFILGFPSFYVRDQEYKVEWDVQYHLYATNGIHATNGEPLPMETKFATRNTLVPLNVVEREFSAKALYTPPGFYQGSSLKAGEELAQSAEDLLKEEIIDMLKTDRIQLSHNWGKEIEIRAGETDMTVTIDTKATLVRLRLELDGELLAEADLHSMSRLVEKLDLPGGSRRYEWKKPIVRILKDVDPDHPTKFTDWNATRTISFKTQADGEIHFFRVLARTRPTARWTVPLETATP